MAQKANQVTETEIGLAALQIAADRPNGVASMDDLKQGMHTYVQLSVDDQTQSETRPNEEMWEQKVRNLVSHRTTPGNIIAEGFAEYLPREGIRITESGRLHLSNSRAS